MSPSDIQKSATALNAKPNLESRFLWSRASSPDPQGQNLVHRVAFSDSPGHPSANRKTDQDTPIDPMLAIVLTKQRTIILVSVEYSFPFATRPLHLKQKNQMAV